VKIAGFQKIGKEPYQLSLATPSGRLGTGLIEIGKSFDLPGSPTATYQIVSYNAKEGFAIIKNLSTPPYQLYKVRDYFVSSGDARTSPATTGPSAALTDKLTPPTVSGPEGSIREIPPDIAALSGDDLEYELTILGVKAEEAREQKQHAFFAKDAGDFYGENMVTSYDRGLKLQYDNNRMRIVNAHTETISPVYTKAQLNEMAKSRDPEFLQKIYARYSSGYGPDRVNVSDFIENSRFTKLPGGSGHLLIDPKGEYHLIPLGRGNSMTIFNSHQFPMDVPQNSNPPPETPGP
jgi:hypothetical protein